MKKIIINRIFGCPKHRPHILFDKNGFTLVLDEMDLSYYRHLKINAGLDILLQKGIFVK